MSKFFKGDVTNGVVELNLLDPAVGAGAGTTATIVTKNTGANDVEKIVGDIPANYASTEGIASTAKGLVIGTSCTSIGSSAFYYCSALTGDLVIPDSVTTIEGGSFAGAFIGCFGFTSLTIGNSVTSIGDYAFYLCVAFGAVGDLVIPDSVTSIGYYAFGNCGLSGTLTIGNSVTTIGGYAFGGMPNLTTAYLAPPLANVGSNAFLFSGLTTVYAKDAVANGWTLGAGQTVGDKTGVTVIDWTNYPNIP